MCVSWALNETESSDQSFIVQELVSHLRGWTQKPPLEFLATIVDTYASSLATEVFDAYDTFLALLSDEEKRKLLEQLAPDEAYKNEVFLQARQVATSFDDALVKLLFESNNEITQFAQKYGVF